MQTLVNGFAELFLFFSQNIKDEVLLLIQLRITVLGSFNDCTAQRSQEIAFYTQKTSVAGSTADQTAQNIAAAFVCRHDPI